MSHCEFCKSDSPVICFDLRMYGVSPSVCDPEECCCDCHDEDGDDIGEEGEEPQG